MHGFENINSPNAKIVQYIDNYKMRCIHLIEKFRANDIFGK